MKTIFKTLLVGAVAACTLNAQAQNADALVKKHIDAVGGADNWKKVTSMKQVGTLTMQGMPIDITFTKVEGKGFRQDMSIMGMENYIIMTPAGGWMFFPIQQQTEPKELSAEDVKNALDQMSTQEDFIKYMAAGDEFSDEGKEAIEGKEYLKLKVAHKNGGNTVAYLDPATYYTYRTITSAESEEGPVEIITTYSDYKKLPEGVVVPMKIESDAVGGEVAFTSVEINTIKDDSIFQVKK